VGFHVSALYSPVGWLSWEQVARDWEAAQGKPEDLKTFKNTALGETWQEGGAPDSQRVSGGGERRLAAPPPPAAPGPTR
jgi:phage terminase large subunit GpA-like protein